MALKAGLLFITLLIGSNAFPAEEPQQDMSIYFDHTDAESRIVGGTAAAATPYMVALSQGVMLRSYIYGGSLVTVRHVLTAAHCIIGLPLSTTGIIVGTLRWNSGGVLYNLNSRIVHPNYSPFTIKNDIGILVTSSNVVLNNAVSLVALSYDWVGGGVDTRVTGWARIRAGGSLSQVLLSLQKPTVSGQQCIDDVARRSAELNTRTVPVDPSVEICTFLVEGSGMCHGDSGSPLVRVDNNRQIGIVSWGLPCALGAPDMFTRVSPFRSWIEQIIFTLE